MPTDYDQLAERYDEDRARYSVAKDDVVAQLASTGRRGVVLDLGCGTGKWLLAQREYVSARSVTFLGADPSPGMLGVARRKGASNLMCAGAEHLPLANRTVDYVVANYTFHHWDKDRGLDEVARVLKLTGAVFRLSNIEPSAATRGWLYEFFPETISIDAGRFWPRRRVRNELERRGFSVDMQVSEAIAEVPIGQAVEDARRRVISQLAELDDEDYERGLTRLLEAAEDSNTSFTTTSATVSVTARRS